MKSLMRHAGLSVLTLAVLSGCAATEPQLTPQEITNPSQTVPLAALLWPTSR